jgi:hypothetical protein
MIQQDGDTVCAVDSESALGELRHAEMQLTYSEYVEGLAAIAVYRDPDPYIPLGNKLESFFKGMGGRLTTRKKVCASSSY